MVFFQFTKCQVRYSFAITKLLAEAGGVVVAADDADADR